MKDVAGVELIVFRDVLAMVRVRRLARKKGWFGIGGC